MSAFDLSSLSHSLLEHQTTVVRFCIERQRDINDQYPQGKGALVVVPPGGGKTHIMAALMLAVPMATVVVAPAHLVEQLAAKFSQLCGGKLVVSADNRQMAPLSPSTVLVVSLDSIKHQGGGEQLKALRPQRIICDEVDTLCNGKHGYKQLMNWDVRQGAACWGFTGTVQRNSWADVRRLLAFVTGKATWERATEVTVKAEVPKQDWYYKGAQPPPLPHKLDFIMRAIQFARPEEWLVFWASAGSFRSQQMLGISSRSAATAATAAMEASAAAAAAAAAAASSASGGAPAATSAPVTVNKRPWVPKACPQNLRGLFGVVREDDDHTSYAGKSIPQEHADKISTWLNNRQLPSNSLQAASAQAAAAKISLEEAVAVMNSKQVPFVPTLLNTVVTTINIEHPDEPVVILCDTKMQVLLLQRDFERFVVSGDQYMVAGRKVFALVGSNFNSDLGRLQATPTKERPAFLEGFFQAIAAAKGGPRAPPVLVAIKACLMVGVDDLQKHVSVMHILSPSYDPSRDYQAISRVHRLGQVADRVRVVTWVQLGVHESRFLHQVFKTQDYGLFQEDVRPLLGLPILPALDDSLQQVEGAYLELGSAGGAPAPSASAGVNGMGVLPAGVAAALQPLNKRVRTELQDDAETLGGDADSDVSEDITEGLEEDSSSDME